MSNALENKLINSIERDHFMIKVLQQVRDLKLNDCWIGAGFVRNKIWDEQHGLIRSELNDIDIIHYNPFKSSKKHDLEIEQILQTQHPILNWSVKNQARMHIKNGHQPYADCKEAISYWPETATAIAIKLNKNNQIKYIAPYGLEDLYNLLVVPTPKINLAIYKNRIKEKKWKEKWINLDIKTNYNAV